MTSMVFDPVISEDDLVQSICRESFYEFVREFWSIIIAENPVWNWHIPYLCKELQKLAERVFLGQRKKYDLLINISPGSTKSTIASIMFPAWVWTRKQSMRSICASYTAPLALDLSRRSRDVVLSEKYRRVFKVELREDQNTKTLFMNMKGGSRQAVGTGNQVTGNHAHFLIVDDPIDPKGARSEMEIKAANEWMGETLSSRKIDKAITPTILIMQRLHQNDPSGNILAAAKNGKRTIKHICLPARSDETYEVKPAHLKFHYTDGLMDPIRLDLQTLKEAENELGLYGYAGQYGQSPIPRGGGMFKTDKITVGEPPRRFKIVVRYWDKAGTIDGGAYTVGFKMALDFLNRYWILDIIRKQWDSYTRNTVMKQTAQIDFKMHDKILITGVEQEPGSGGKESAETTVRELRGFRVRIDIPKGDKALRADPFSAQVNGGNVFMKAAPWNEDFLSEAQFFPNSTYKDQVDAGSGAFAILSKPNIRVGGL